MAPRDAGAAIDLASSELEEMMESAKAASDFLKALSNETRLVILCLLADGEKSVTELESILQLRQPTVSQQLARLRADELVSHRRDGKTIYYSLASEEARRVMTLMYEMFCKDAAKSEGR
ncbi:MAG: metalloregulator ArsR/SmtB family transcription factor [Kiloniellales bacterium]|nr:metalloregulator ArsR/SmtB family transcription factor [Kiloniellales bacterium]